MSALQQAFASYPAITLALDFLTAYVDPRITYSGGTNGTRVNSSGVIVAATTPRFDYNPTTLAARGLLVEEARTNLLTYSQEFDNAAWVKATANATVTANATTSPDGTANADAVNSLTASGDNRIVNAALVADNSATYTATLYVKQNTSPKVRADLRFIGGSSALNYAYALDFATGVFATVGGNTATSFSATAVGSGWYRLVITAPNNSTGNVSAGISIYGGIDAGNAVAIGSTYAWGAQLEAGSFPTSYIPTTTAAVTRTADSAVMTGTNFSSWYNQSEGTFDAGFDNSAGVTSLGVIHEVGDGGFNERMTAFVSTTPTINFAVTDGGVQVANFSTGSYTTGNAAKVATAYALNNFAGSLNGGTVATDTSGTIPTVDALYIGRQGAGGAYLNGHVQTIAYYPRRMSNEQLQALTA